MKWSALIGVLFACCLPLSAATSNTLLEEAFAASVAVGETHLDYAAWATCFAEMDSPEMVEVVAGYHHEAHFANRHPSIETCESLLCAYPACDTLLNTTAWTYYLLGCDTERAYDLVRRIQVHTIASRDTLALLTLRRGYPADALQYFLDLLEEVYLPPHLSYTAPDRLFTPYEDLCESSDYLTTLSIYDHAGNAFYKNGYTREAALLWTESLRILQHLKRKMKMEEADFLPFDFNPTQLRQKLKAIRLQLNPTHATSAM